MGTVYVDDLRAGMILSHNLCSPQGRMLLSAGTRLEEKHIRTCRIWGVTEVQVKGVTEAQAKKQAVADLHPEVLEICKKQTNRSFFLLDIGHPTVSELARQIIVRTARRTTLDQARDMLEKTGASDPEGSTQAMSFNMNPSEIVARELELVSLPDIFNRIMEAVNNPRSSASHIADIISKDTSLAAKLLRLVNSPLYGFAQKVDNLTRAVALVGTKELTSLAAGVSVMGLFDDIPAKVMNMRAFWEHSVGCGVAARLLAARLKLGQEERFFVAGLLHDIGRLVMCRNHGLPARLAMERARVSRQATQTVEKALWGFDHARLGGMLLTEWTFPDTLCQALRRHHAPGGSLAKPEEALTHVSDILIHAMGIGCSGSAYVPPMDTATWDALGLPKSVISLVMDQIEYQVGEIMNVFFSDE